MAYDSKPGMSQTYKSAGVDIAAGDAFICRIKKLAEDTHSPAVLTGLGGFAAHYALSVADMKEPVLVSSTDGVGTKLRIAIDARRYDTIGIDLVAMCVNDLACSGARPLFFLDYFATGTLRPEAHADIISGIAAACKEVHCALVGGETAEMPGLYQHADFDLAGFAVGIVERAALITGASIAQSDAVIGIASTGFHSNGYSLLRKVILDAGLAGADPFPGMDATVSDILLRPTRLYSPLTLQLQATYQIRGIAHITGGGLTGNIPRILPGDLQASIAWDTWARPPECQYIQRQASMSDEELRTVFNCGIGLVLIVPADEADACCASATTAGFPAQVIGIITPRTDGQPPICYTGDL